MPMPAVLGTIAQEGQAGGGGGGGGTTDPTIGTGESGNYDKAISFIGYDGSTVVFPLAFTSNGSDYSNGTAAIDVEAFAINAYQSGGTRQIRIFGYIREGSSDTSSPSWTLHSLSASLSGGASAALNTSSYNQHQDNTLSTRGYTGIGAYVNISAGGGRGGLVWGAAGDTIQFKVKAQIGGDDAINTSSGGVDITTTITYAS
tara:strand:- start:1554 stop:2159 length:606 start_codon:yes stop_codon:yes gene_type:complete